MTKYPHGLSSFGIPVIGSGIIPVTRGTYWFVDGTNGSDGNKGMEIRSAFKTITAANAVAKQDDVILILPGTYTESVATTVSGLRFCGLGSTVKEVVWTATDGGTATTCYCLSLSTANCEVSNIYFKAPAYVSSAAVTAINLSNASYACIDNCRFQGQTGSYAAIYSAVENSDNVNISDNVFAYFNTASNGVAIYTLASGGLSYSLWTIFGNIFTSNVTNILLAGARICSVRYNTFDVVGVNATGTIGTVTTLGINLSGTSSGGNQVHQNFLNGAYTATLYKVGASGDDWAGNFAIGAGTGVASGITTANPA